MADLEGSTFEAAVAASDRWWKFEQIVPLLREKLCNG